jgi:hypothetical protein
MKKRRFDRAVQNAVRWISNAPSLRAWAERSERANGDGSRSPLSPDQAPPRPRWARGLPRSVWNQIWMEAAGKHRENLALTSMNEESRAAYLAAQVTS